MDKNKKFKNEKIDISGIESLKSNIEKWLDYENNNSKNTNLKYSTKEPFSKKYLIKNLNLLLDYLEKGLIRVIEKEDKDYKVNKWVKDGILLYFKHAKLRRWSENSITYLDKFKYRGSNGEFRFLPGSVLRKGAFVGKGTVVMPPSFINVGAYIDEKSMVDSLALIGSCAQIGKNCHISAGTMIGGVLEPAVARPVIIEDNVFVGGNCGIYEGVLVRKGAVIGTGTIINASTPIIEVETGKIYYNEVPEDAIVIPGARKKSNLKEDYYIQVPLIIKYRGQLKDPAKVDLNEILHDF